MINQSWQRISAVLLRHLYILRSSPARLIEIIYWPTIQMVLWGFISQFLAAQNMGAAGYALGTFLGAVILWDLLFRTQLGVSLSFMEEIWARNLGHLFVSPLRPMEWWASMMLFSIFRALLGMIPAALMAIPFFGFSIFDLGWAVLLFFFNLMFMGWWLGFFITSVLIRVGPGAESIAWALTFFLAPLSAVYYPVTVLPEWLQYVAHALPASHVFEGLRQLVQDGTLDPQHMVSAFGLNCVYMIVAMVLLQLSFNAARHRGTLLQAGE